MLPRFRQGTLALAGLVLAALSGVAKAEAPVAWAFPGPKQNGAQLRTMLDQPESWARARTLIGGIGYADHALAHDFSDDEQRRLFAFLARSRLRFGLESGALKQWGPTASEAFAHDKRFWDRFVANGARIDTIAMDEPLSYVRHKGSGEVEDAASQVADFVAFVRAAYPRADIGDIEPLPGTPTPMLVTFLQSVENRLRARGVRGLDFFRADLDWMHFRPGDRVGGEGWAGVKRVEDRVHAIGLRFQLIYWAANYPSAARAGAATATTWEDGVGHELESFAAVGGRPDQAVLESWIDAPASAVPDTARGTFTHSIVTLANGLAR